MTYDELAAALVRTNVLSDPWIDGAERFRLRGVVLAPARAAALFGAAARVGELLEELARLVWAEPDLLDTYFHLTPYQKLMWLAVGGAWHGLARADLFETEEGGVACCEVNSDTPSGEAEAVLLNRILHADHGAVRDPNAGLEARFVAMLRAAHGARPLRAAGIVYPTEMTEDLSMVALYREWLEAAGIRVVLGSPYNLSLAEDGGLDLLGEPVDLVLRHYKTDWWGEREPVWFDQAPFADAAPLDEPLLALLDAARRGRVTVVNPFGSVVTQNKLALAFCHEHRERFSAAAQATIAAHLPETRRLNALDRGRLAAEREAWVLKSDYGCEGEETLVGAFTAAAEWRRALEMAIPEHWVAQRFFRAAPDERGAFTNFGVYLVGGAPAGCYTRLSRGMTTRDAQTLPTYIQEGARA